MAIRHLRFIRRTNRKSTCKQRTPAKRRACKQVLLESTHTKTLSIKVNYDNAKVVTSTPEEVKTYKE